MRIACDRHLKHPDFASESEVRLYGQAGATGALVEPHLGMLGASSHIFVTAGTSLADDALPIREIRIADVLPGVAADAEMLGDALARQHMHAAVEVVDTPLVMG